MGLHVLQVSTEDQTTGGGVGRGFKIKYPFICSFTDSLPPSDTFILLRRLLGSGHSSRVHRVKDEGCTCSLRHAAHSPDEEAGVK